MVRYRTCAPLIAVAIATAVSLGLAGCQQVAPGALTRSAAQADVATWTRQVVAAAGSPAAVLKLNAFDDCAADPSYFSTTSQWRRITDLAVPQAAQQAVTTAIEHAFVATGWKSSRTARLLTVTGPTRAKHEGSVTVETDGPTQLAVVVVSPCY